MPALAGPGLLASLLRTAIVVGLQYLYGRYERKRQERLAKKRVQAIDVAYTGALEPRRKLYGRFRAAGLHIIPAITDGVNGERLFMIMALSEGEISQFESVIFNNDEIVAADIDFTGVITGGSYQDYARVLFYDGAPSTSYGALSAYINVWTSDHDGRGIAGVFCEFDANNEVYKQGAPNVLVVGEGALVYDPRLDTSLGANPTSPTYLAFYVTPALQLVDFLTWASGGNELAANINWADVEAAADICEEAVTIPFGAGTTTQPRYTSSYAAYAPQQLNERNDTIRTLARAMMGVCWFSGGKWRMKAGAWSTPRSEAITDNDYLDDVAKVSPAQSIAAGGVFNAVRGSFVDAGQNTQPVPFPEILSTAFETEDGERKYKDVEYACCNSVEEAQRNAILELLLNRTRQTINGLFRFRCFTDYDLYDIVPVTLTKIGYSAVYMRIVGMRLRQNFTVELSLERVQEADYDDPDTGDYTIPGSVGPPTSVPFTPGAPQNLSATGMPNAIIFEWDPPANAPGVLLYQLFEHTASTPFSSAVQVGPDSPQTQVILAKSDTTTRYYWVRAKIADTGAVGTQAPPSNGVPAAAASAGSGLSAFVLPGSLTVQGFTSSLQTDEAFVTASAGTAPYTYATTWLSGGTSITTNDGTTSSPYFSATGLSEGETRSGTAQIRVIDNVAATFDVFVAVTITRGFDAVIDDVTITSDAGGGHAPAIAIYTITSTGEISVSPSVSGYPMDWLDPSGDPADYDVRFTLNSGTLYSGTTGTWLNLASTYQVRVQRDPSAGVGTTSANVTAEIRPAGGGATIDSAVIVLNATQS